MIERTIMSSVIKSIKTKPVTLITGARQVGKSTLCKELVKEMNFNYVTLDNLRDRQSAIQDPELFLKLHKWPLIIDEVQFAPRLFEVIEEIVNKQKFDGGNNYGMFVLTGSQTYKLMEGVSESMAGRVSIIKMPPLSMSEINKVEERPFLLDVMSISERVASYSIGIEELYERIVKGFYPELYDNPEIDIDHFYSDYIDSYINKDVSQIINLKDKLKFQSFMEILASLTGEELVYDSISKAVGVSIKTIQSWISILVAGDIIYLLQPYNELSVVKRVVKRPKIYFSDTGLACFLARINDPRTLRTSIFNGRFIETYIVNEIRKSHLNNRKTTHFYYYRDSEQKEVDLIMINQGKMYLVECKAGVSYKAKDVSSFKVLESTGYEVRGGCIICTTDRIYSISKDVIVFPVSSI